MSLLTVLPPTVDDRKPVFDHASTDRSPAALALAVAFVTLLCVVASMVATTTVPLMIAAFAVVAGLAVSLVRPTRR